MNPTLAKKKLNGDLEAVSLFDLCQFLMIARKTGSLRVDSRGRRATLTVIDGHVVGAIDESLKEGEDAFHRVLGWTSGTFEFGTGPVAAGSPSRITTPTDALLLEAAKRLDEAAEAGGGADDGSRTAAFLEKQRFAHELADLFSSLEPPGEDELDFRKEVPLETLLGLAARRGAFALSLRAGETPKARGPAGFAALGRSPVTQRAIDRISAQFLGGSEKLLLEARERASRERLVEGFGYVRVEARREEEMTRLVVTLLQSEAPAFETLGVPEDSARALARARHGLVLIASPPRGGKSALAATLAAAAGSGAAEPAAPPSAGRHIAFYEESRRFRLREESGILEQCDLPAGAGSRDEILAKVWRQKADVIVLDAARSAEHLEAALGAAESGALAVAAVEADGAVDAIARFLRLADDAARPAHADRLAGALLAVVAIRPSAQGESPSPVTGAEILLRSARLAEAIRAGDLAAVAAG